MREVAKQNGIVVVVAANQFHYVIIRVIRQGLAIVGTRMYAAATHEGARHQIQQYRQHDKNIES